MKKSLLLLIAIMSVGLFLRLYRVSNIPPALSWDEVSIGYNAYSILKTGHDEHGRFLPLDAFTAYGDYKPPLAIYITVPFVALLGLNELSVRLPSVLFGTGVIILTYLIILELLSKGIIEDSRKKDFSSAVALVASFSVALSPWAINLSRAGFEANIGLFFVLSGIYMTLVARGRPMWWILAWLPLVAAIYTFNSSRYFAPFIGLGLVVYSWRQIVKHKKQFVIGLVIAGLALIPILPHLLSKEARLRFVEVNIFTDSSVVTHANKLIAYDNNSILADILHNRRIGYLRSFFSHYFDNFSPDFLFVRGDGNPKFSTQDVGQLYLLDLPFLLIGIIYLFRHRRSEALLVTWWLLSAIIPAATARETPHALRILNSLPAWHIFIAFGILSAYRFIRNGKTAYCVLLIVLYLFSCTYYLYGYYIHYPRLYSNEWQYGYKQALEYVSAHEAEYRNVYITESIGRAYMYTLFYLRFDPEKYVKTKKSYFDAAGFYHVDGFDKYVFMIDPPSKPEASSLYIFPPGQLPAGVTTDKIIPLINGEPVLAIFGKK